MESSRKTARYLEDGDRKFYSRLHYISEGVTFFTYNF
jgi:hypothetical protein